MPSRLPWSARHAVMAMILVAIVLIIVIGILRPTHAPSQQTGPKPTSSSPAAPAPTLEATEEENSLGVPGNLEEQVYLLEEALNLPPSEERNRKLAALSTPEGFESAKSNLSEPLSNADKATRGITVKVSHSCTGCIQVEPFDALTASVASQIRVETYRDGRIVNAFTSKRITAWVYDSGMWKFAGEQFDRPA